MADLWTKTKRLIRASVPAAVIIGNVPQYFAMWVMWRTWSILCPNWIYQAGDDIGFSLYQRLILFFFEHTSGVKIYLHGDAINILEKKEKVVYMSNHQCTMDWMVADMIAIRQGSLGHLRFVMKTSLQLLPLYGHYFYQHGCIFVRRGGFNIQKMVSGLNYLSNKKINSWLIIFPEGTRYNPDNKALLMKHRDLAIEQGLEPFEHVLTPRPKGMQLALKHLSGNMDAIYDTTIAYSNTYDVIEQKRSVAPSIVDFLSRVSPEVHIHIRRIELNSVPLDNEEDFKEWLQKAFVQKDRILNDFFNKSREELTKSGTVSQLPLKETVFSVLLFTSVSIPFVCTSFGRSLYWKLWLFGSLSCYTWLGIRSVA